MYVLQHPLRNRPKTRVELHIHLDGAIRHETIWEMMRKKNIPLPGDGSLSALKDSFIVKEPQNLFVFLTPFGMYLPAFAGDLEAIERFSYEFVEDQAKRCVAYCEARFCPHLLLDSQQTLPNILYNNGSVTAEDEGKEESSISGSSNEIITVDKILEASLRGLKKGEEKYKTKVRLILCCIRGQTNWSWEILRLCEEYRDKGVVGIDVAGDEGTKSEEDVNLEELKVFQAAKEKGIHRTVHAGESGGPLGVEQAISMLGAERIGHGYRTIEDEELYQKCLQHRIHFEMCPHSSILTGSIKNMTLDSKRHPILRLAEDGASFSINTDDPTLTGTDIEDEYRLLQQWGFTEAHFTRANFEAAFNSFLPPDEKEELISNLKTAYGVISYTAPSPSPSENGVSPATPVGGKSKVISPGIKPDIKIASWEDRSF